VAEAPRSPRLITAPARPGVNRELTRYAGEGGWYDSDKVRFRYGQPEKIGGWQNINGVGDTVTVPGVGRSLFTWVNLAGTTYLAVGTNSHLMVWDGGQYFDITPVDTSVSASNIISTSAGSTTITVSVSAHGHSTGDYFYFTSVVATVGGNIYPVSAPLGGFSITVVDANSFTINTGVTAAATSASSGGVATGFFIHPSGFGSNAASFGWGAGVWSGGQGWGTPASSAFVAPLRYWSMDNWGEDLVASPRNNGIYYWDSSQGTAKRAYQVTATPSQNTQILVSPEDRHLISFGCPDALTSVVNPLYIRWCSQEDINDWTASATNTAGDKVLSGASKIVAARRTRGQILIWTDENLYSMQQVGPPYTFGFQLIGTNCGVLGQNAMTEVGGRTYWMADERFMMYDGAAARPLKCDVLRYVFEALDRTQLDKIVCGSNTSYNEVIWFYPTTSGEVDSYVIYDYMQDLWSIGTMVRTAWIDQGIATYPIAAEYAGSATKLYYHEYGNDADGAALPSYIESNLFDLDAGQELMYMDRIIPDFSDRNGDEMPGNVEITLHTLKYPNTPTAQEVTKGPFTVSAQTQKIDLRIRGRHAYYRIDGDGVNTSWRLGAMRFRVAPDGER
jgi:hypothetical protein